MSLIYQALKQTEQEAPAAVVAGTSAAVPRATPMAPPVAASRLRKPLLLGAAVAGAGILAGLLLSQRAPVPEVTVPPVPGVTAAPAVASSVPADVPPLPTAPAAPLPSVALSAAGAVADLPVAEPALPTVPPRLTLSTALSVRSAAAEPPAAVAPAPAAAPAPAPAQTPSAAPAPAVQPVSQSRPSPVEVTVRSNGASNEASSNEDISELFDGLNRALEARDEALAQRHLQGIRSRLPEGSLARLRAEGWHAYRTGDAEQAQRVYRRLLEKLPGDENASLTLASIERQRQRPDQAREVLARSLRQNPNSAVLRAALDQASQSEAAR